MDCAEAVNEPDPVCPGDRRSKAGRFAYRSLNRPSSSSRPRRARTTAGQSGLREEKTRERMDSGWLSSLPKRSRTKTTTRTIPPSGRWPFHRRFAPLLLTTDNWGPTTHGRRHADTPIRRPVSPPVRVSQLSANGMKENVEKNI